MLTRGKKVRVYNRAGRWIVVSPPKSGMLEVAQPGGQRMTIRLSQIRREGCRGAK